MMQGVRSTQRTGADPDFVLRRAVAMLDAFGAEDTHLGVSELARRTGVAKTTTLRLCEQLVACGLLEAHRGGANRAYRLGMRLFELGQLAPRQRGLREAAAKVLADLHTATRETVHLAVLDGVEVVYLDILYAPHGPRLPSRVGGRMPAHATGVGKAILAGSPEPVVRTVLDAGLASRTPHTITTPGRLHQELAAIAERGTAYDHEESGPGIVCAASPVFGPGGAVLAGLSVSGRIGGMSLDRVAPAVRTAALTLSRQLGHG
jgi:DNA-binding IclR family transcriptional regulator